MACCQFGMKNCDDYYSAPQVGTKPSKGRKGHVFALFSSLDSSAKNAPVGVADRNRYLTAQFVNDLGKSDDQLLLLLFDSVNNATENIQAWLMDTFLVQLSLLNRIRVVVAGRSLPEAHGSYTALCRSYQLLPVAEEEAYITYCKSLNVRLAEQSIRDFAYAFDYKPGMFADYVLPKFVQRKVSNG
jgi:hypothetical protein